MRDPALLTIADCAKRLAVSEDSVLALVRSGRLRASNIGLGAIRPRWRVRPSDLETLLDARTAPTPAARRRKQRREAMVEYF